MSYEFNREDYIETAYIHAQASFSDKEHPRNVLIREIPVSIAKVLPGIIYQKIERLPYMKGKIDYLEFGELVGIIKEENRNGRWKYFRNNHKGKWLVLGDVFSEATELYSTEDIGNVISSMRANHYNESVGFIAFERPGANIKEHIHDYGSDENKHFEMWVNFFIDNGVNLEDATKKHVKEKKWWESRTF